MAAPDAGMAAPDAGMTTPDAGLPDAGAPPGCEEPDACMAECMPGTRSCSENAPRVCSAEGTWQNESECQGATPVCDDGACRCRPGSMRCNDSQPQVCDASRQWIDVGDACENCTDGRCSGEGCTAVHRDNCGMVGCECALEECSGAFCPSGDGCTPARRTACAALGCSCVDGGCAGGFCDGTGCTTRETMNCEAFGCECVLHGCVGGPCAG